MTSHTVRTSNNRPGLHLTTGIVWAIGLGLIAVTCAEIVAFEYAILGLALVVSGGIGRVMLGLDALELHARNAFELGRHYERSDF